MSKELFENIVTFKFDQDQVKRILTDLLVLTGEDVPRNIYNQDGDLEHDNPCKIKAETSAEYAEDFEIFISFDSKDLKTYRENLKTEMEDRANNDSTTADDLPDSVWTQDTTTGSCGKECPLEQDDGK